MSYWIKTVPDAEPNADGRWIQVPDSRSDGPDTSWCKAEELFKPYIQEGEHIVAVSSTAPHGIIIAIKPGEKA